MTTRGKQTKPTGTSSIEALLRKNNPVPAMHPVDPDALMNGLVNEIQAYVMVSKEAALATALWCIHTWCYDLFARSPLLLINAPERACGKTQLLKVVEKLVPRALDTAHITMAGLFRMIEQYKPTLLIDEADTFMDAKSEMAGLLNKGYERGGFIIRIETDKHNAHDPRTFQVFAPKALAGITLERHLADATMSRGIQISMRRKTKDDKVKRLRAADPQVFESLRSGILRFVLDHKDVLAQGWDDLPVQLDDRQQDNWEPLLAIAHCFGDEWYRKAIEAALTLCAETAPPRSTSNQLLEDIREVMRGYPDLYISTAELLEKLKSGEDMDWCRYNRGDSLTPRQLAKFLCSYSIKPRTVRKKDGSTPKGYEVRELEGAFGIYLSEISDVSGENDATLPVEGLAGDAMTQQSMAQGAGLPATGNGDAAPERGERLPIPKFQATDLSSESGVGGRALRSPIDF